MTENCDDSRVFRVSAYMTVRILLGMEESEAIMACLFEDRRFMCSDALKSNHLIEFIGVTSITPSDYYGKAVHWKQGGGALHEELFIT